MGLRRRARGALGLDSEQWLGQPTWLKLVYLLVALPAWLVVVYCVVTGQNKSFTALAAVSVFAGATILSIAFDRRPRRASDGNGVEVDDGGGGGE
jgi:hypothetical protein